MLLRKTFYLKPKTKMNVGIYWILLNYSLVFILLSNTVYQSVKCVSYHIELPKTTVKIEKTICLCAYIVYAQCGVS